MRHGDGTLGWADAAPFDAILVAAGGPEIPEALRRQLKIGGRLIIPIGELGGTQELVKVVRDGEDRYHEEDLGPVTFVPLIGAGGWGGPGLDAASAFESFGPGVHLSPPARHQRPHSFALAAEPLPDLEDPAFGAMFDRFAEARVVLLGEATHGTSEFYRARAQIYAPADRTSTASISWQSRRDWPDAARIDRYVRHKSSMPAAARPSAAFRSGCGATSRSRTSSTGCVRTTRRHHRRARRVLRLDHLQHERLDRRGDRIS